MEPCRPETKRDGQRTKQTPFSVIRLQTCFSACPFSGAAVPSLRPCGGHGAAAPKIRQPWITLFNSYLMEQLAQRNLSSCRLEIECLDLIDYTDDAYKENLAELLRRKYSRPAPDVITITCNSAINSSPKKTFSRNPQNPENARFCRVSVMSILPNFMNTRRGGGIRESRSLRMNGRFPGQSGIRKPPLKRKSRSNVLTAPAR